MCSFTQEISVISSVNRPVIKYVWPSKAKPIVLRSTAQREADHAWENLRADDNVWRHAH